MNSSSMKFKPGDRLLPVDSVAAILGTHRRTVYRLVENGELPRAKIGTALRIPQSAVIDYVNRLLEDSETGGDSQ